MEITCANCYLDVSSFTGDRLARHNDGLCLPGYLLFGGDFREGGAVDFDSAHQTLEDAIAAMGQKRWYHVFSIEQLAIVWYQPQP